MMSYYCSLDLLPVEILQTIFTYFSAHEIVLIFFDVSAYVNAVLRTYSGYRLNCQFIRKSDFDLIRSCIQPQQVASLTLSDHSDTFIDSEKFLSHFQIEQFTQLRSIILIDIEFRSLKSIFFNLYQLDRLRSLSFNVKTLKYKYPTWNDDYSGQSNRLKPWLHNDYIRVLPQLNHICLNNSTGLMLIQFPHLRCLKLEKCSLKKLERMFHHAVQLQSLDICLNMNILVSEFIMPCNHLIRLNLNIQSKYAFI